MLNEKEQEMLKRIMESPGYAYVFLDWDHSLTEDYLLETTPENLANFIGKWGFDSPEVVITDLFGCLILSTRMGYLDACPNQELCYEIVERLAPIQQGERAAGEVLAVDLDRAEEFLAECGGDW